jgi:hypothetical protein
MVDLRRREEREKKKFFLQKSIILSNKHFFEEYFLPYHSLSDKIGIKSLDLEEKFSRVLVQCQTSY